MPITLSILLRTVYLAGVLFIAFWLGIGIAMGFDSGVNPLASLIAFLYLFTFIPALLLGALPLTIITKPPIALKVWYGWIFLLGIIYTMYGAFGFSKSMIGTLSSKKQHPSGTVCFQLMDAPPNSQVWMDMGSLPNKIQLRKFGSVPLGNKAFCRNYGLSLNPLQIQVYSANDSNKRNFQAASGDRASEPFPIQIVNNGKTCVGIYPDNSVSPSKWTTKVVNCEQSER